MNCFFCTNPNKIRSYSPQTHRHPCPVTPILALQYICKCHHFPLILSFRYSDNGPGWSLFRPSCNRFLMGLKDHKNLSSDGQLGTEKDVYLYSICWFELDLRHSGLDVQVVFAQYNHSYFSTGLTGKLFDMVKENEKNKKPERKTLRNISRN